MRLALGAGSMNILWLVLRYGLFIGLAGVALGVAGSMFVRQALTRLLHGVALSDSWTLAGTALLLLLVIAVASAVPAATAIRIDPVKTLRSD